MLSESRRFNLKQRRKMPSKETMAFAHRLEDARASKYKTAAAFARTIGVEDETYRTWERGEREPHIAAICKIARALDVSLDYLILGDLPAITHRRTQSK